MTPRILVCDDTPAKRYVLSSWLRRSGYEVVESSTAAEAAEMLRSETVDLAVLDVHLPDGSGLDITRALRSDPRVASVPVIHVSAVARETADKVNALDEGADAYLVDPIEPDELLSTVRALLRSSGARRDAELLADRLAQLNRAAVRLNVAASVPRLVDATARAAADVLGVPAVALLLDDRGAGWRAVVVGGDLQGATALPADEACELLADLRSDANALRTQSAWGDHLPATADSWTHAPISIGGALAGVLAVSIGQADDGHDDVLLQRLAQSAAVALENLRALEFEHRTALTLQRSLLPGVLPEPPGLQLAARYRASQQRVEVGGDFFDAFVIDGRCHLVIGDVQGHSLEAAVVMAELRYSLRAYAYEGHPPATIMGLLDTLLVRTGSDLIATACIVTVDADRRAVEVVSAGHPPPVLLQSRGPRVLDTRGLLLGAGIAGHPSVRYAVQPGDRLVMYTDGLIERRGQHFDDTLEKLVSDVVASDAPTVEDLADELLQRWSDADDDVALLVLDVLT